MGRHAVWEFVDTLAETDLVIACPQSPDYERATDVLRNYNDAKIDFVDACIVAMAERMKITKILTVDRRHFQIFRPRHCDAFEILP